MHAISRPEQASTDELLFGSLVGDYVIGRLIAQGGCGAVYGALHLCSGHRVAIKVLHRMLSTLPKMVERFTREVEVVSRLRHPNIVEMYDAGELADGRPFYAMEYLDAVPLDVFLQERGPLSPREALSLLEPVCAALSAAHAAGVIHRDVKASNIAISRRAPWQVKLLDFGIAKLIEPEEGSSGLTSAGRQPGTLTIMAPEQLLCRPIDARIDVYALGVLLHRMLTGRLPFESRDPGELVRQHLEEPAPRPSQRVPLPPALDAVALRCLEKEPEARFESVNHFISALRQAVGEAAGDREESDATPAMGVGLYVEILMHMSDDDVDDTWVDDVGQILDLTEEGLRREGFLLSSVTSNGILGVKLLPEEPGQVRVERRRALEFAAALHEAISLRHARDSRVHVNICVHAGELIIRCGTPPEILGGELVRADAWAPRDRVHGLCATADAVRETTGFAMVAGPGSLFVVDRAQAEDAPTRAA